MNIKVSKTSNLAKAVALSLVCASVFSLSACGKVSVVAPESIEESMADALDNTEGGNVLKDETGTEFSASTLLIYFKEKMTDEETEQFCKAYNLTLVYNYDIVTGIAVKLEKPAESVDELDEIINKLSEDDSVISVEKDYIQQLDSAPSVLS